MHFLTSIPSKPPSFLYTYKIILLGDVSVGKTCIVKRLLNEEMPRRPAPTVGIEYANKVFEMKNGGRLMTQIWDTAGQEKYKSICMHHYRDAIGAIMVFDLTRKKTFENCQTWLQEFKAQAHEKARVIVLGNKLDMIESEPEMRRVDKAEAEKWAAENDVMYMEVSALKNRNIYEAIEKLLEEIYYNVNSFDPHQLQNNALNGSTILTAKKGANQKGEISDSSCCY